MIEVTFKGYAIPQIYQETLDIIQEIGLSNKLNNWVFNKENFSGLTPQEILKYIVDWANKGYERFSRQQSPGQCAVVIIAQNSLQQQLERELETGNYDLTNLRIMFQGSATTAFPFLSPEPTPQKKLQKARFL